MCGDYDLRIQLYEEGDPRNNQNQDTRLLEIQRSIQNLRHAVQCRDANCSLPSCQKMKRVVNHTHLCPRKMNGCPICKQFIGLCCYHGLHCQETICPIPLCSHIRNNLERARLE